MRESGIYTKWCMDRNGKSPLLKSEQSIRKQRSCYSNSVQSRLSNVLGHTLHNMFGTIFINTNIHYRN